MASANITHDRAEDLYYCKGRDMWIRARTNAFAHKLVAVRLKIYANLAFMLQTLFVVIPIICVGLSLQIVTVSDNSTVNLPTRFNGLSATDLGILAIISNGIALFISIISIWFQWSDRAQRHWQVLSGYQLIAQKARRLENTGIPEDERSHLCRHLEETFEIYKTMGLEPSDKIFVTASGLMLKLNTYPFDLNRESLFNSGAS